MARSYVFATDISRWSQDPITDNVHLRLCAAATAWLTDHEGDELLIAVRPVRNGEADGVYEVRPDGSLQILGCSYDVPGEVSELLDRAMDAANKMVWG